MVLEAFREVRKHHQVATLVVIGDRPSDVTAEAGVTFAGFLRKEVFDEYTRFLENLAGARTLVSATSSDNCLCNSSKPATLDSQLYYIGSHICCARNRRRRPHGIASGSVRFDCSGVRDAVDVGTPCRIRTNAQSSVGVGACSVSQVEI